MAFSSSSNVNAAFVPPNTTSLVSLKLEGPNYQSWTAQFIPALRTNDLMSIVDGSKVCPSKFVLDNEGKPTSVIDPAY
jgi:hypothetical protein